MISSCIMWNEDAVVRRDAGLRPLSARTGDDGNAVELAFYREAQV